ncbi:hypothetical protein KAI04_01735 [Candidatus Pacearchaeota archaeon]|nr:hypothetical protein [Candidatus Pacearchaeota archaeon]
MFKKRVKKGAILMENVVFIILNILFLSILILFLLKQGQGAALLEQSYAKQIALLIDSAEPGMTMILDMSKAKDLAEKNGLEFKDIVINTDNIITVRLSESGGYSYSYFKDVDVSLYPDNSNPEDIDSYVIKINEYK